jgi:hypothetical protein
MNNGWSMFPIMYQPIDLTKIKPPLEMETSLILPDDTSAWVTGTISLGACYGVIRAGMWISSELLQH